MCADERTNIPIVTTVSTLLCLRRLMSGGSFQLAGPMMRPQV